MTTFSPPQIVSYPSSVLGPQMLLVARTDSGFAFRFWKDDNVFPGGVGNRWLDRQSWQFDPQNPPFDWTGFSAETGPIPPVPAWPLLGYIDQDGVYRANAFFAFADVQSPTGDPHVVVGQPWWQIPIADVAFDTFQKDFLPRVGTTWYGAGPSPNPPGAVPRLNIFGSAPFGGAKLRELYWDGANWNWHDHNLELNGDELGPSSLIFPQPNHGYLFGVTAEKDNVLLFAYQPAAVDWGRADFPTVPDGVTDLRAPVALTYSDDRGVNVSVFTVGLRNGKYHLFSIHQIFGHDWEGWQDYGAPPDEPVSPCEDLPSTPDIIRTRFLSGDAFTMTSACVGIDDQGLHIHLFGHSDILGPEGLGSNLLAEGVGQGALVHFSWEGGDFQSGNWSFEATTRPVECLNVPTAFGPATLQAAFETTSCAIYQGKTQNGQTRRRISAVGVTRPGNNNGNVWEYALDTALGQGFQWLLIE
jgi:hypothetical protein